MIILRNRSLVKSFTVRHCATLAPDQYNPTRQQARERKYLSQKTKNLPTVDRKLFEISKYRKYSYLLSNISTNPNLLDFNLCCTNTHLLDGLPKSISIDNIKDDIFNTLFFRAIRSELGKTVYDLDDINAARGLGGLLWSNPYLRETYEQISDSKMEFSPQNCAYWRHKDFQQPYNRKLNAFFQYKDTPIVQIRITTPLVAEEVSEGQYPAREVPDYYTMATPYASGIENRHLTSIPGFWPNDVSTDAPVARHDCALLTLNINRFLLLDRKKLHRFDMNKSVDARAVIGSFAWATSLATYHGFTIYNDLTYPMVVPAVYTDGHTWYFYLYQLNTMSFGTDYHNPQLSNLCWKSGPMPLLKEDGQPNEAVPNTLLALLTRDRMTDTTALRPYLGPDDRDPKTRLEDFESLREIYCNRELMHDMFKDSHLQRLDQGVLKSQ